MSKAQRQENCIELDKLSDVLEKKLMAAETPEELSALAKENGYELNDEVLESVAGGGIKTVRLRPGLSKDPNCRRLLTMVPCVYE